MAWRSRPRINLPIQSFDSTRGMKHSHRLPACPDPLPPRFLSCLAEFADEPARIMIAIGDKAADRWHLELSQRWVVQYNVYINTAGDACLFACVEIEDPTVFGIVREVGFGNIAMGTIGLASLFYTGWVVPAAVAGGLYYGLASVGRQARGGGTFLERTATDILIFALLAIFVAWSLLSTLGPIGSRSLCVFGFS